MTLDECQRREIKLLQRRKSEAYGMLSAVLLAKPSMGYSLVSVPLSECLSSKGQKSCTIPLQPHLRPYLQPYSGPILDLALNLSLRLTSDLTSDLTFLS